MNQVAAVQVGNHLHPRRQDALVQFLDLRVDAVQGAIRLGALAQKDDSFHFVRLVEDLAWAGVRPFTDLPEPDSRTLGNIREVPDADGRAIHRFQDRLPDVGNAAHQPDFTHIYLLGAHFDEAAAGVDVVVG